MDFYQKRDPGQSCSKKDPDVKMAQDNDDHVGT